MSSSSQSTKNWLLTLPNAVWYHVCPWLSVKDFFSVAQCNRYWQAMTNDQQEDTEKKGSYQVVIAINKLWKNRCISNWPFIKDAGFTCPRWVLFFKEIHTLKLGDTLKCLTNLDKKEFFYHKDFSLHSARHPTYKTKISDKEHLIQVCVQKNALITFKCILKYLGNKIEDDTKQNIPSWTIHAYYEHETIHCRPIYGVLSMMKRNQEKIDIFNYLVNIEGCKLEYREEETDQTLLTEAARRGQRKVIQSLLAHPSMTEQIINMHDPDNDTAFYGSLVNGTFYDMIGEPRTNINIPGGRYKLTPVLRLLDNIANYRISSKSAPRVLEKIQVLLKKPGVDVTTQGELFQDCKTMAKKIDYRLGPEEAYLEELVEKALTRNERNAR